MTNTIEDVLKPGISGNCSNIKISPSVRSRLLEATKDEKQPGRKERVQKLEEIIRKAGHGAFVKCVEWTRTCDAAELSDRGVM